MAAWSIACGTKSPPARLSELWALRYGSSRLEETAVFADGKNGAFVEIAWILYALKWEGRWIVIDPGFDDPVLREAFGVAWTDPLSLLSEIGVRPEKVHTVLVTHGHFDHAGLVQRFPYARVIINRDARRDALARSRTQDQAAFWRQSPRIETFDERIIIDEGFFMEKVGGHAFGSSVIRLEAERIILTGDEAYLPANWEGPRFNGSVVNPDANRRFLCLLSREAKHLTVLTMHDPSLVPHNPGYRRLFPLQKKD